MDRKTSVKHNGIERYAFDYDPNGNTTKETDRANNQVTTFTYDVDNKLKTMDEGNSNTTEYTYDKNGNVTQRKHTAGSTILTDVYTFNNLDQLTKITENGNVRAKFTYEETDKIASRKNGDGTTSLYRYNGAGDLLQVVNYTEAGEILDSYSYTYNPKGNITSVTSSAGTTTYDYDELDQLTKETKPNGDTIEYTYDEVGNRLTKKDTVSGTATTTTYTYNDANEVTSVGGTTYTHDPNGNLTTDGKYTYEYDAEDRLTAVKENGNTVASFTYRADGMRKTMTTSSGTITFHYDENKNVIYETNETNQVVASYTYNGNQPVSMTRGSVTYYYQLNGHGDVVALTIGNGTVVATYTYDAFGNVVNETGTVENPYRYAGYRYDKVTGLYYLQARYYQPDTGRFLTLDPDPGDDDDSKTQNGYTYGDNNPVMTIDPDGHFAWVIPVIIWGYRAYRVYRIYQASRNSRIDWKHIRERHGPKRNEKKYGNKGKFKSNRKMKKYVERTIREGRPRPGKYGRTIYEKSFNRYVGRTGKYKGRKSKRTKRVRVIWDRKKGYVTGFPY